MTQDNYNYRTNPFFLRNQFNINGKFDIPLIPKSAFSAQDFHDLRLIGFDKIQSDQGKHASRIVHFFLYDYKFERVWEKPDADIENLEKYRAILTPDFSMYTEMPDAMLLYNVFRNRWCGAYYASKGLRVIPSINFGLKSSFDFCFEGVEKGSVVAVSTYMVQAKEGRKIKKIFSWPDTMKCFAALSQKPSSAIMSPSPKWKETSFMSIMNLARGSIWTMTKKQRSRQKAYLW